MDVYSIVALLIRLFLAFQFWREGRLALKPQIRSVGNVILFVSATSVLSGFYVYAVILVTLIYLGLRMWVNYKNGVRLRRDPLLFLLTLIIFLKGPGTISLDKLLGNI